MILNENLFGPLQNDSVVIVVQVVFCSFQIDDFSVIHWFQKSMFHPLGPRSHHLFATIDQKSTKIGKYFTNAANIFTRLL